ncbi:MAG: CRISPR-associated endonuclease Cas2, partial [Nitrososphaerota archaeon]|nr:CRISPR-associated endonuclease Cas2 [Nitrososphaerota archaeon]
MQTLIVYDISDDEVRLKVSEACKRFGLARIQR